MESIKYTPKVSDQGLAMTARRLYDHQLNQDTSTNKDIRISPRGELTQKSTSLYEIVSQSLVFAWWEHDPQGIAKAAQTDPELRNTINAFTQFTNMRIEAAENSNEQLMADYALTETMAALDILGQVHVPKDKIKKLQKYINKRNQHLKDEEQPSTELDKLTRQLRYYGNQLVYYLIPALSLTLLQKSSDTTLSHTRENIPPHISVPFSTPTPTSEIFPTPTSLPTPTSPPDTNWFPNPFVETSTGMHFDWNTLKHIIPGIAVGVAAGTYLRIRRGSNASVSQAHEYKSGERRGWLRLGKKTEVMTIMDNRKERTAQVLIVNNIFNHFDEETRVNSKRTTPQKFIPPEDKEAREFSFRIDFETAADKLDIPISIPRPFPHSGNRVEDITKSPRHIPAAMSIIDSKGNALIANSDQLKEVMYEDELGNITLHLDELKPSFQKKIAGKKIKIHTWYTHYEEEKDKWYDDAIQMERGLSDEQFARSTIFEKLSGRLVDAAYYKTGQSDSPENKIRILQRLTHFLGDIYLKYDERDARHAAADQSGLSQADRVLLNRKASCEGATVALSRIVRQTISTPYEGVMHVDGFQIKSSRGKKKVIAGERHGLLMYVNTQDESQPQTYFLDATPSNKEKEHKKRRGVFKLLGKRSKEIKELKAQIVEQFADPKAVPTINSHIKGIAYELEDLWHIDERLIQQTEAMLTSSQRAIFERNRKGIQIDDIITATYEDTLGEFVCRYLTPLQVKGTDLETIGEKIRTGWTAKISNQLREIGAESMAWDISLDIPRLIGKKELRTQYAGWRLYDIKRILGDENDWQKQRKVFESAYPTSVAAAEQNVDGLWELVQSMLVMKKVGEDHVRKIIQETIPTNRMKTDTLEEFMDAIPWHTILPNPLLDCEQFFSRSTRRGNIGNIYPVPDETDEFNDKVNRRMALWNRRVLRISEEIKGIIEEYKNGGFQQEVSVSSTYLWRRLQATYSEQDHDTIHKKINPKDLYLYIIKRLYETTYRNGLI